ncbi:MAG: HAD-IA family hydrolase [Acetobacteraceae bacterium]|nr:HAD-IA family hydrolase [Acetobacteraceae bacterium]
MPLRALIFDVDGTLAETEELHRESFNRAFADAGLGWNWDRALYARLLDVTGGKERIAHYIGAHGAAPALDAAAIAKLHAAKTAHYTDAVAAGLLALRPGVARLLDEAEAARLPVAIATTTTPANVEALLRATLGERGPERFAVIGAGDCVPAKKPAPDIYHFVLARLGLRPEECIAIEDTENGLLSARAAGIPTVITVSLYGGTDRLDAALAVLDHLGDPGQPCHMLRGPSLHGTMLSLAQLREWVEKPNVAPDS